MALDILFINPGNQKAIYQDLAREFTAVDVPVWACLLAESIRRRGRSVRIHDMNVSGWDGAIRDRLLAEQPRLIAVLVYGHHPSASTQTMPVVRPLLQDLKAAAPQIPVVLGVIIRRTASGSRLWVRGSISANTGVIPCQWSECAVAMKV